MSENPYKSSETGHPAEKPRSPLGLLARIVIYGAIIALVVALLLPAKRSAREASRRNQCLNNFKQILLALQNYHDTNGTLPPAYTVDEEGNRLHSWRTLILPYIEGSTVQEKIDLTKPWDHPDNAAAREVAMEEYLCPSAPYEDECLTTYLAVVGPDCTFAGSTPRTLEEVTDGSAYPIAVIEVPSDRAVHWMSPEDITPEELLRLDADSQTGHPGVFQAAFLDGHVEPLQLDIDRDTLAAKLTIAGREETAED